MKTKLKIRGETNNLATEKKKQRRRKQGTAL
jgi:hypothetical protein